MVPPQPTGRNRSGYAGEPMDLHDLSRMLLGAAETHGWEMKEFHRAPDLELHLFHRSPRKPARRIYLSAGIHGDEPAGPLAIADLLQRDDWPPDAELWICPCLNPTGFQNRTRQNAQGIDLNRDYRSAKAPEVRAHLALLNRLPQFDLTVCLHEDWESRGFYLYELNPDCQPTLAEAVVSAVSQVCPIDPSAIIDGRAAETGIIRPNLDPASRQDWPEAFYLIQQKTRLSYTLEAPSDFELPVRVTALTTAVHAMLGAFVRR